MAEYKRLLYLKPIERAVIDFLYSNVTEHFGERRARTLRVALGNGKLRKFKKDLLQLGDPEIDEDNIDDYLRALIWKLHRAGIFRVIEGVQEHVPEINGVLQCMIAKEELYLVDIEITAENTIRIDNVELVNRLFRLQRITVETMKSLHQEFQPELSLNDFIGKLILSYLVRTISFRSGEPDYYLTAEKDFLPFVFSFTQPEEVGDMTTMAEAGVDVSLNDARVANYLQKRVDDATTANQMLTEAVSAIDGYRALMQEKLQAGELIDPTDYNIAVENEKQARELLIPKEVGTSLEVVVQFLNGTYKGSEGRSSLKNDDKTVDQGEPAESSGEDHDDSAGDEYKVTSTLKAQILSSDWYIASLNLKQKVVLLVYLQYGEDWFNSTILKQVVREFGGFFADRLRVMERTVCGLADDKKTKKLVRTLMTNEERSELTALSQARYKYRLNEDGLQEAQTMLADFRQLNKPS